MSSKISLPSLSSSISNPIDLVITCASFEDRCLSASLVLPERQIASAIIFFIEEFSSFSSANRSKLRSHFKDKGQEVSLFHNNPRRTADKIIDTLDSSFSDCQNILVDISTFTRESLLILIKALEQNKQPHQKFQLVYTCAENTSTNLSYNPIELRSVMGYMGEMKPAMPLHLVIMLGFEYERAQQVIDEYEPDYISIGCGSSTESISNDLYELNVEFKERLISIYTDNVIDQFVHSLVDPFNTEAELARIIDQKTGCNTAIVPLNNKISTVGAALLAIKRPEIQICYTQMGEYNIENYSKASNQCYVINLW